MFKHVVSALVLIISLQGCGGGGGSSSTPVGPPADTTPPVVTISGDANVNHEQGTTYSDAGATATDNVDGDVSVEVSGSVDDAVAGTYNITYSATDQAGNSSSASRTVQVQDTIPPVITLNGEASITIEQGTVYSDPGATATDSVDGTLDVPVSGTVETEVGEYTLTYTATDAGGNSASVDRIVTVIEADAGGEPYNLDVMILDGGLVDDIWGGSSLLSFFDEKNDYGDCTDESAGTETCASVDWEVVGDETHGDVLQVTYLSDAGHAGLVVGPTAAVDLSDYAEGSLSFDIKIIDDGAANLSGGFLLKVESGSANSGELPVPGINAAGEWESVTFAVSSLTASGALNLSGITAPMVVFPAFQTGAGLVYQIDNVRFTGIDDGATPPTDPSGGGPNGPVDYTLLEYGAGNVSNVINPASYRCAVDYGNWIYNAGLVEPAIAACNASTRIPTGTPTPLHPQLTGEALTRPVPTHKWWGSIPFLGEMTIGDANDPAYLTPDPIRVRVSNKGARLMGIPGGYKVIGDFPRYDGPVPFDEVFDGIAIANSAYSNLNAYLKDHSDGSVTVRWKSGDTAVMDATFVHGSPYAYFKVYEGHALLRTKASDSTEKGTFYQTGDHLGVWTDVSGVRNSFLVSGEGNTTFSNVASNEITISNAANEFTLSYLPVLSGEPSDAMSAFFAANARNVVASVDIDYSVDRSTNMVTVSHAYFDEQGTSIETIAGLHPLHWKHSSQLTSNYKIRSARGIIKFAQLNEFSYEIPYVGVLPTMPSIANTYDQSVLEGLVTDFIDQGEDSWINSTDTYWSGKAYGKAAELAAIADSIGMQSEATQVIDWLKAQLSDWFTAETGGELDVFRYFVYDEEWDTLLGLEEAYGSHQRLADHHFHYGYFVRAAAEVCRVDGSWCGDDQFGPMIELLIRDYAGSKDDDMFPYLRNFDPANGFSWADGKADALQGNNNESTSEAANAYGAIVLYGLITGNDALIEKGMYLHASTAAAYWQYWNNIDGYKNRGGDHDNFPSGYNKITTSIIWASGADFATWFSGAYAHILGIQGLPSSPLIFHVSQYSDYMADYVALGLTESSNGKPSGLIDDQWRDLWWNLWAMTDADAAIADYNSVGQNYAAEAGESKAHTYHWIHTFSALGQLKTGTGELTSNNPAALAFDKNGKRSYVVYNFTSQPETIVYSDGKSFTAAPNGFTTVSSAD
jgi:endo-1,3(4)-beta-glucanase